jgi:hypothetical protein
VAELMRGKSPDTGPPTDPLDHPPKRLLATSFLRVLQASHALELGHPLFNLNDEHVVVEFWLKFAE